MKTLLQIQASIFSNGGQSSRLAERFVSQWRAANPGADIVTRDLARDPVPHLTAERFQAFLAKPEERTLQQDADAAYSDTLIDELKRADVIVLGLPMYNFGLPSSLKAYFDHIARAGRTFSYTEKGPVGLLTGKKAYVLPYVRDFLRFLGINDVEFVYAEGLGMGDAAKNAALAKAENAIGSLIEPVAIAA